IKLCIRIWKIEARVHSPVTSVTYVVVKASEFRLLPTSPMNQVASFQLPEPLGVHFQKGYYISMHSDL
ncbi:hypothetical protein, partial [Streptococcus anginosus]|uniref:hypothetical protein n=1 Tax=Streptococcus anginosus TaxID=1328 RepID=UPI002ED9962F